MKKIVFLCMVLFFISIVFFYTNTYEYKMQNFQDKYAMGITALKPIYKKATNFCSSQNFANRGEYTACMEESIKNFSIENYNFFIEVQNFCENLTDNLADKWSCIDLIMD